MHAISYFPPAVARGRQGAGQRPSQAQKTPAGSPHLGPNGCWENEVTQTGGGGGGGGKSSSVCTYGASDTEPQTWPSQHLSCVSDPEVRRREAGQDTGGGHRRGASALPPALAGPCLR